MWMKKRMMCLWTVTAFMAIMGFGGFAFAGDLEPSDAPAPTMKTLDEIPPTWSQKLPATERFELVLDNAAVLDKETGLVWEQSPDTNLRSWETAIFYCYNSTVGDRKAWRLPTVEELASLVDPTQSVPALSSGHPFSNVKSLYGYWSATTSADDTTACYVDFSRGGVRSMTNAIHSLYVWCVRGGQGHEGY